jgi:hypothetical protein
MFLQQDLHPALSGREIVDLPPIVERERRDVLRDPEPASSTVAAVLDYQSLCFMFVLSHLISWTLPGAQTSPPFGSMMGSGGGGGGGVPV